MNENKIIGPLGPKDVILVVDMVNGFAREGALASPEVENLIPKLVAFLDQNNETPAIFCNDRHPKDAGEFNNYPPHCIEGTEEAELVSELQRFDTGSNVVLKNSTNALMAFFVKHPELLEMLKTSERIIICGCVTDICIKQLAISLVCFFRECKMNTEVVVVEDLVTTFDTEGHCAQTEHNRAIAQMKANGVTIANFKGPQYFPPRVYCRNP